MVGYVWRVSPLGVRILFVSSFLMNLGFYALIPYLTLYVTGNFAWSMAMAGILLGIRQFSQQGVAFLGGMLADRIGCKAVLIIGVIVRAIGFFAFAFCTEVWEFIVAAILSGLGGALFEPAFQAAFVRLTPEEGRKAIFSFRNVVVNIGIVASTLVSSILAQVDFFYLCMASSVLFMMVAFFVWIWLPHVEIEKTGKSWIKDMGSIMGDRPFVIYTAVLIGYHYLYMQLFLTVPRMVEEITGDKSGIALIYGTISLSVIIFQLPVTRRLANIQLRFTLIGIGTLLLGMSLFFLGFAHTIQAIILIGLLFALGTMIAGPVLYDIVPMFAPKEQIGAYYGFNNFALAVGGALSTSAGGWFYDMGTQLHWPLLSWGVCLAVAVLVCWRMYKMEGYQKVKVANGRV
jgi:DHA1 family multidrug resistance protein-like MFS transporter